MEVRQRQAAPNLAPTVLDRVLGDLTGHEVELEFVKVGVRGPINRKNPAETTRVACVVHQHYQRLPGYVTEYQSQIPRYAGGRMIRIDQHKIYRNTGSIEIGEGGGNADLRIGAGFYPWEPPNQSSRIQDAACLYPRECNNSRA